MKTFKTGLLLCVIIATVVAPVALANSVTDMHTRLLMKMGDDGASADALLLETGDYLLLETGDKLLSEV